MQTKFKYFYLSFGRSRKILTQIRTLIWIRESFFLKICSKNLQTRKFLSIFCVFYFDNKNYSLACFLYVDFGDGKGERGIPIASLNPLQTSKQTKSWNQIKSSTGQTSNIKHQTEHRIQCQTSKRLWFNHQWSRTCSFFDFIVLLTIFCCFSFALLFKVFIEEGLSPSSTKTF